jgi:dynactin 1
MERLSAGSSSPARKTSVTQNFSPSRPSPARAASFNPLQQRLNRAAGMPSSSISSRNLAGLASSGSPDKRGSAGPHAAVSGLVERSRSQPSPTPSPSSTPTPAPRPPITGRVVRPSSSLSQTTTSGLPAPEAISTGTRPSSRASSVASSRTRISRPSSVASDIDPASRAESRQSNFDHHTEGRTSVASVREIEEEVEELQATPKASLEPRKFGRGLAQGLAARAIQKPTAEESQSGGDNVSPADIFRAARDQRAGSTVPTVTEQMAHSGSSNVLAEQAAARVHSRETEDLRIKVRVLEARRAEDAERIKNLEVKALQADGFAVIREKFIGNSSFILPVCEMYTYFSCRYS